MEPATLWWCFSGLAIAFVISRLFTVPSHLRHFPRVPILPLLVSYLSCEVENVRINSLILPYANEKGEGFLVWALGRWMIHILDHKLALQISEKTFRYIRKSYHLTVSCYGVLLGLQISSCRMVTGGRDIPESSEMLLTIPVEGFTALAKNLFDVINPSSDDIGSSVPGHDFDAIRTESLFVNEYKGIMHDIANPLYLIMPFLEKIFPHKEVIRRMDNLVDKFKMLLREKRSDPGDDMMTFMLKEPMMSEEDPRDNMVVFFIAGHDTSAGGLSTLIYFLAIHQEIQAAAREEALCVLGPTADPSISTLSTSSLSNINACVREALRINTPITYIVPRITTHAATLGKYYIPPNTSLIYNIYAIHHRNDVWGDSHFSTQSLPREDK